MATVYKRPPTLRQLASFIFWTRWLQAPLYVGLIVAQGVYVYHFWLELVHLVQAMFGNEEALRVLVENVGYEGVPEFNETVIMLVVLALIDVVMISNLLIMVIVGGYETFVSRLDLGGHPDQPEWLSSVNASVLKVKLATAIIGISSIHLSEDVHQRGQLHRKGVAVADSDPPRVPVVGNGDRGVRPDLAARRFGARALGQAKSAATGRRFDRAPAAGSVKACAGRESVAETFSTVPAAGRAVAAPRHCSVRSPRPSRGC